MRGIHLKVDLLFPGPQMLVYENYNKFISATDTIRSMKSNVDGMDATMQELRQRLGAPCALNF